MFGEKSSRKDIRKELSVSTKQNFYRELFHHFFVAKHCLTQVFSKDTPAEKCFKKTPPEDIRRELSHKQNLCRDISPPCSSDRDSIPQIYWGNIRTKKCEKKSDQNISEEKSPPNKNPAETLSTSFLPETFSTACVSKKHIYGEMFGEKSSRKDIRKELSAKQNLYRELFHHFFVKKHCLTQVFSRNTPTEKCFKKNTTSFAETFLHHVLPTEILYHKFLEETSVPKSVEKSNQNISEEKSLPNKILSGTLSSTTCFSQKHIYGEMFGDKSPRKDIRKKLSTKQKLYRELFHHFFGEETLSNTIIFKEHPWEMFQEKHHQKISEEKSLTNKIFAEAFLHLVFIKKHSLPRTFWRDTTTEKCEKQIWPKDIRRENSAKQTLCRDISPSLVWKYWKYFRTQIFWIKNI